MTSCGHAQGARAGAAGPPHTPLAGRSATRLLSRFCGGVCAVAGTRLGYGRYVGGAAVHILGWDGDRQVWLARRDGEPSFVWVQDFADAYQAAHVSRGVDLIVPVEIYREWVARKQAPKEHPPGVWLV